MDESRSLNQLNRSMSSPDLFVSPTSVCRRVFVEEVIKYPHGNPLIRHYSCEEILNGSKSKNLSYRLGALNLRNDEERLNSFINYNSPVVETPKAITNEETPMDIDSAPNSIETTTLHEMKHKPIVSTPKDFRKTIRRLNSRDSETIMSSVKSNDDSTKANKRRLKPKKCEDAPETNSTLHYIGNNNRHSQSLFPLPFKILVVLVSLGLTAFVYYENEFIFSDINKQAVFVKNDLERNVLGQADPVLLVSKSLEEHDRWPKKMKVLPFVGSSGVGKTHIANIIKKYFHYKVVHEMSKSILTNEEKLSNVLTHVKDFTLNVLIIDDLSVVDMHNLIMFLNKIPEKLPLLVVPIFSVQHVNDNLEHHIEYKDYRRVELGFDKTDLYHEIVIFSEIEEDVAQKWLVSKIRENPDAQSAKVGDILRDHDVKHQGLKGLLAKLNV